MLYLGAKRALLGGKPWNPGLLIGPSDLGTWQTSGLPTIYQDSAGTTPVTAVGQPVGLRRDARPSGGNHARQATTTARPALSARVNLLIKTDQFNDASWEKNNCTITPDVDGIADRLTPSAASGSYKVARKNIVELLQNKRISASVKVKDSGAGFAVIVISGNNGRATYNLNTGAVTVWAGTNVVATVSIADSDGYKAVTFSADAVAGGSAWFGAIEEMSDPAIPYVSDGTKGILIKYAQLEVANAPTRYQRVNTAADYDTVGFPTYIDYDGIDDVLVTTFPSSLGSNCTIARAIPGVGAVILTGQTIGATYSDNVNNAKLFIINRPLTAGETSRLTNYLNARSF